MRFSRAAVPLLLFAALAARAQPGADLEPASRPASSLELAACSLGSPTACFEKLLCGLRPKDRSMVQLYSDGSIGVDQSYASNSANFVSLRLAARAKTPTRLYFLGREDRYQMLLTSCWPLCGLEAAHPRMGHPDEAQPDGDGEGGFMGYTFFPFGGIRESGVLYSVGSSVDVFVQIEKNDIAQTAFHELRHVLAGEFGAKATQAFHSRPGMTADTLQAEREAAENCRL